MRRLYSIAIVALVIAPLGWWCDTKAENRPLEVARSQPPKPLVSEVSVVLAPEPRPALPDEVVLAGHRWAPTATTYQLDEELLKPVGVSGGLEFYAFDWDQPPFDRLLVSVPPAAPADLASGDPAYGPLRIPGGPPSWRVFQQVY